MRVLESGAGRVTQRVTGNSQRRGIRVLLTLLLLSGILLALAFTPLSGEGIRHHFVHHSPPLQLSGDEREDTSVQLLSTSPAAYSQEELVQYMLDLINEDRRNGGLTPVTRGYNSAAQKHAEERAAYNYLSHWGRDGMKPYMRYTLAGGFNYEAENGASISVEWAASKSPSYRSDISQISKILEGPVRGSKISQIAPQAGPPKAGLELKEALRMAERNLMKSPGHRSNILNKWHTRVNIGIAYTEESVHVVQEFEGDYIRLSQRPRVSGNILFLSGKVSLGSVFAVVVHYDPLPRPLTREQLLASPYNGEYSLGELAGKIVPPPPPGSYYAGLKPNAIVATKWDLKGDGSFSIDADIGAFLKQGRGVYTVQVWSEVGGEQVPLTTYSIFLR